MVARLSSFAFAALVTLSAVAACAATAPTPMAKPSIIQIAKVTCAEMLASDALDRSSIMMFYWGYVAGKAGSTALNTAGLEQATSRVMQVCVAHQDMTVLAAIDAAKHGSK